MDLKLLKHVLIESVIPLDILKLFSDVIRDALLSLITAMSQEKCFSRNIMSFPKEPEYLLNDCFDSTRELKIAEESSLNLIELMKDKLALLYSILTLPVYIQSKQIYLYFL